VVAPGQLTFGEMIRGIGQHIGRPVFGSLPVWMAKLAMGEMVDVFTQTQNVEPRKALLNDMEFRYPSFGLWLSEQKWDTPHVGQL
jgi:NAD dependent epimerase/dehydratase family enzyme